jgi:hypothetical protein
VIAGGLRTIAPMLQLIVSVRPPNASGLRVIVWWRRATGFKRRLTVRRLRSMS